MTPPQHLPPDQLEVWAVWLEQPASISEQLAQSLLSADEQERAARFHFEQHRRHFRTCRTALRLLLGGYLGRAPAELRFQYGLHGKPELTGDDAELRFNVAHSRELALLAFGRGAALGVDVEALRRMEHGEGIARRFFSAREQAALATLPPERFDEGFFRCWTRKESFIKASGLGLSHPLDGFDVSLGEEDPPALLALRGDPAAARSWAIHHLEPATGYVGALTVQQPGLLLRCHRLGG